MEPAPASRLDRTVVVMGDTCPPDFASFEGREEFMRATWGFVFERAARLDPRAGDLERRVIRLFVFDGDPKLELTNYEGKLVRLPNPAAIAGLTCHIATIAIGPGVILQLLPKDTDPLAIGMVAFCSWDVFCALVVGRIRLVHRDLTVETVEPFTAAIAFSRGLLDGLGLDEGISALTRLGGLIAEAREAFSEAQMTAPPPSPAPAPRDETGLGEMPSDAEMAAAAAALEKRATAPIPATPGPRSLRRLGPPIPAPAEVPL